MCFQCVDTLALVLKHAEGMSLRCDAPSPIVAGMNHGSVDKYCGGLKQKHKKQPFGDASASHLSLVLRHV